MGTTTKSWLFALLAVSLSLSACAGGNTPGASPTTYTIGGTVSGLSGTGLVLQENLGSNLPIGANGSFTFATAITAGGSYNVTVLTQPSNPAQTCTVTNGSGTVSLNVTSVLVNCTTNTATNLITFEDLTNLYFSRGGNQNIGNFYPGITFGPNVKGLSVSRFGGYANDAFPPHSGDVAVWDPTDPTIIISFVSPIESFGVWYTSFDPLTLEAFDQNNNLLGTVTSSPNTDGSTGATSFLTFSNPRIKSVTITSTPGLFVLDDVTF